MNLILGEGQVPRQRFHFTDAVRCLPPGEEQADVVELDAAIRIPKVLPALLAAVYHANWERNAGS